MKTALLLLLALSLSSCATAPAPNRSDDVPVYRPSKPMNYPLPR